MGSLQTKAGLRRYNRLSPQFKGLRCWWPSIFAGGTDLYEPISGFHGALQNMAFDNWAASGDRQGYVLELNGIDQSVLLDDVDTMNPGSNTFTVSAWVKPNSTATQQCVIHNGNNHPVQQHWMLSINSSGAASFEAKGNLSFNTLTGLTTLTDDEWHLITAVRESATSWKLYVDGQVEATDSTDVGSIVPTASQLARIGATNLGQNYSGQLDDLRYYNRALLQSEVVAMYNRQTRWDLFQADEMPIMALFAPEYGVLVGGTAIESVTSAGTTYNQTMSGGVLGGGTATTFVRYNPAITSAGAVGGSTATTFVRYNPAITSAGAVGGSTAIVQLTDNITPTGGVLGGSSATIAVTYTPLITPAGVVGGGTATVAGTGGVIVGSGGILGGSTAPTAATYNITPTGGVLGGSTAMYGITATITPTGGAVGGSTATAQLTENPLITSAGVLGGSSATTVATYNPLITSAGVLGGSSATTVATYNPLITSAGGIVGGTAQQTFSDVFDTSGGVLGGGTALQTFNDVFDTSGGVVGGSSATTVVTYNPAITSAGVLGGGTGTVAATGSVIVASGGILGGSSATTVVAYNPALTPAGAVGGSTAVTYVNSNPVVVSAGVIDGGTASQTLRDIVDLISAGVLASGSAVVENGNTIYGSGGAISGGTPTQTIIASVVTSGGVLGAGTATQTTVTSHTASGGALGGSSAIMSVSTSHTASGGALGAGTATQTTVTSHTASGGALGGSSAVMSVSTSHTASGGVLGGSSAVAVAQYSPLASNGAAVGSTATASERHNPALSGGSLVGGTVLEQFGDVYDASGGALGGSTATVAARYSITSTGGTLAGGSAVAASGGDVVVGGGTVAGGTALVRTQYAQAASGGSLLGGTALAPASQNVVPQGGIRLGGHGAIEFTEYASGGVVVNGGAFGRFYAETMSGGAVVGQEGAVVGDDHVFRKVKCESELKCGYAKKDQFCAFVDKIQGFSSKFMNPRRNDPTAVKLSRDASFGSTAILAATTFCQQDIRVDPEDLPDVRTVEVGETPSEPEPQPLMMMATLPVSFGEETAKENIKPTKIHTPQMAALQKLQPVATPREQKPVQTTAKFKTVEVKKGTSSKAKMEVVKRGSKLNTPQMAALKKGEAKRGPEPVSYSDSSLAALKAKKGGVRKAKPTTPAQMSQAL